MPSCWRRNVLATIAAAALYVPAPAWAQSCEQLWHARNSIFAAAGHCFKTPRAIATFGARCHPPYGQLTRAQEARVNSIKDQERQLGCSDGGSGQDAQVPLPPQPPDPQQGAGAPDPRLNEAASVWGATKDTNSAAVLEAFVSRFGDTPFGDLARARLDEVKKSAAAAKPPQPQTEASKPPAPKEEPKALGETEMCPKYLPSVGRTVQAPCEH
jgi:hypothetical protein